MRKRIVIGLLILSAIGTAVFFVLQPKEGSVEWHQRQFERHRTQYLEARDRNTWPDRLKRKYYEVIRSWPPTQTTAEFHEQLKTMQKSLENMRRHREALARLGYVIERRFTWSEVKFGRREDEPKWEQAVRKADVP